MSESRRLVRAFIEKIPNPSLSRAWNRINLLSCTGFSRYRDKVSGSFPVLESAELIPNLGGTTDLFIVRPKSIDRRLRAFLYSSIKGRYLNEIGKNGR